MLVSVCRFKHPEVAPPDSEIEVPMQINQSIRSHMQRPLKERLRASATRVLYVQEMISYSIISQPMFGDASASTSEATMQTLIVKNGTQYREATPAEIAAVAGAQALEAPQSRADRPGYAEPLHRIPQKDPDLPRLRILRYPVRGQPSPVS